MSLIKQDNTANLSDDVLGTGKATEKLLDVISKGLGKAYEDTIGPRLQARKIKIISKAETEAECDAFLQKTKALVSADEILNRVGKRILVKELKRESNIENIIHQAFDSLDQNVSDVPVNSDWATRFFDIAQDISEEEIQILWAKILAGEIKQPNTFSLRTLEILRNISKDEATIFSRDVCPLVSKTPDGTLIIKVDNKSDLSEFNLSYNSVIKMRDAGLVSEGDILVSKYKDFKDKTLFLRFGEVNWIFKSEVNGLEIPIFLLTTAGQELYGIQKTNFHEGYKNAIIKFLNRLMGVI